MHLHLPRPWAALSGLRAWFQALGLAFVLAACGGGGGGGGSDFRVSLDRSSIELTLNAGEPSPPAQVRATATGTAPSTLFVGAVVEGEGIDPVIVGVIEGMQATFTMQAAPGLQPGVYTGRVQLLACSDANCNNRIGGTPLFVSYRVTVRPVLRAEPAAVSQDVTGGTATQQRVRVSLPEGASSFSVNTTGPAPWMRVSTAGNEIVLDFPPWRSGNYFTTLDIVAGGSRVSLAVNHRVNPPAGGERDLAVEPGSLSFSTTEGAASTSRNVLVAPASWSGGVQPVASVRYPEGAPSGWLGLTATPDGLAVVANAAALTQGSYTATLVLTPDQPATAAEIPVALSVGPGLVRPADVPLSLTAETSTAALSGSAAVELANPALGAAEAWTASSSQPWLQLTAASGNTGAGAGSRVAWSIDAAALAALANFEDHVATITLRAASPVYSPVSFDLRVEKRLPEVRVLGPATVVSGRTTRLHVRGRGFLAVADLGARFSAAGMPMAALERVSDTELTLQLTPAVAGTAAVQVSNALGLAPAAATLTVVPPRAYAEAVVASGGTKRALVVDAARQAVYAVNVENETLVRYRFNGSSWALDAAPVPGILDAGLSPDGSQLLVSATPGQLRLLDAETLATGFTLEVPGGLARNLSYVGYGISTTNDGLSWLPAGDGNWNELLRFDHATRTLLPRPDQPELRTTFFGGPWSMVSRDGSTLAVVQSGSITPSPPALLWRSRDPLLRPIGAGPEFFYEASWADDASRILVDALEVRDGNFSLVGTTRLDGQPEGPWSALHGVLSPDGRRAYVLAYAESVFSGSSALPRVFVFDSSTLDPASSSLPLVGHFDLPAYPGCRSFGSDCLSLRPRMAIAPDGLTLFFAGNERFIVAPVPEALRSSGSSAAAAAARARALRSTPRLWPWAAPSGR